MLDCDKLTVWQDVCVCEKLTSDELTVW